MSSAISASEVETTSDAIDEGLSYLFIQFAVMLTASPVNVLKGRMWDDDTVFDKEVDKAKFRDYEAACDRVKAFYKEQHGQCLSFVVASFIADIVECRKADHGVQHQMQSRL